MRSTPYRRPSPMQPWPTFTLQLETEGWFAGAPQHVRSNPEMQQIDIDFAILPCPECECPREYHPFHSHERREFAECGYRVYSVCPKCGFWREQ